MAESVIDTEIVVLIDHWPGVAKRISVSELPLAGMLDSTWHNIAQPSILPGTKLCTWNDDGVAGQPGMSTWIYLQYESSSGPTVAGGAAKYFVSPDSATVWWIVTADQDDAVIKDGPALFAVMISAMTDAYWGWFWCGGIAPLALVTALAGDWHTLDATIAGNIVVHDQVDVDYYGLGPCSGNAECVAGFALADDD